MVTLLRSHNTTTGHLSVSRYQTQKGAVSRLGAWGNLILRFTTPLPAKQCLAAGFSLCFLTHSACRRCVLTNLYCCCPVTGLCVLPLLVTNYSTLPQASGSGLTPGL